VDGGFRAWPGREKVIMWIAVKNGGAWIGPLGRVCIMHGERSGEHVGQNTMPYPLHKFALLLSAMAALLCVACDPAKETWSSDQPGELQNDDRLSPGGVLPLYEGEIRGFSGFRGDRPISTAGEVTLPHLGSIQVAGLTRKEAVERINSAYEAAGIHPEMLRSE